MLRSYGGGSWGSTNERRAPEHHAKHNDCSRESDGSRGEGRAPERTPAAGVSMAMAKSGRAVFAKWKTPEGEISDKATDAGDSDRPETSDNTHR